MRRFEKEGKPTGDLNLSHTFFPSVSHYLSTLHSSLISYLLSPCVSWYLVSSLCLNSLTLLLSVSLLSLSNARYNTFTCTEAAEYNIHACLHLNVNLNCVGFWRGWYIQQLCVCVCVSHMREGDFKGERNFYSSPPICWLFQSIIDSFFHLLLFFTCVAGQQLMLVM